MGRATVAEDTLYRAAEVDAPLVTKGCERERHLARRLVLKHLYSVCMAGGRGVYELLVRGWGGAYERGREALTLTSFCAKYVPCIGKTPLKADHGESSNRPFAYSPIVDCIRRSRGVLSPGWLGAIVSSETMRA